jgi:hypothetical protein
MNPIRTCVDSTLSPIIDKTRCATLTIQLIQNLGQTSRTEIYANRSATNACGCSARSLYGVQQKSRVQVPVQRVREIRSMLGCPWIDLMLSTVFRLCP